MRARGFVSRCHPALPTSFLLRASVFQSAHGQALRTLAPLAPAIAETLLVRPARVFDGVNQAPHEGWSVLVEGDRIAAVGPGLTAPAGTRTIDLPGATL